MIKAIIFDMDGTLLDSETLSSKARDYGFMTVLGRQTSDEENAGLVGMPVKKVLSQWFPETGDKIYDYARNYFKSEISTVKAYRGIRELIARLRNGYRLAVVTSSHRADAEELLSNSGLRPFFEFYISQEDTSYQKPDPEPVLLALTRLGVLPGDAVFVGDQPYDVIAAHEAGVIAIGATWGYGNQSTLEMYHPEFLLKDPDELPGILQGL